MCLQQEPLADEVMASMAREMNLSETAVVLREDDARRSVVVRKHSGQRARRGGLTCH